jgi:glycosyltransferase involved in cell wall biosynthesis
MPVVVTAIVARLWRKPLSLLYYGGAAADFISKHRIWVLPLLRRIDVVAVTSEYLKAIFGRYGIECRLIRPIGDFRGFRYVHRERIRPILLSSRYLEPIYEVDTIVRAFRMVQSAIPPAKLIVAGSGSELRQLEDYAARHRLRVEFKGNVKLADMPALLKQADVYINAARVDNLPVSVIEAMHGGLLVITTPVGELRGLIDHGVHGLFFETSNAALLARTIVFALRHQNLSLTCIRNAREKARGYSWPNLRDRYIDLFCPSVDHKVCRTPTLQDCSNSTRSGRACSIRHDERDAVPEREMEG